MQGHEQNLWRNQETELFSSSDGVLDKKAAPNDRAALFVKRFLKDEIIRNFDYPSLA